MDDEKIQKIYNKLLKELNDDIKLEEEIVSDSKEIASHLILNRKCRATIDDTLYQLSYRILGNKLIIVVIADINKYKILNGKYTPFLCKSNVDKRLKLRENIAAIIEAFIRQKLGKIKPEMVE